MAGQDRKLSPLGAARANRRRSRWVIVPCCLVLGKRGLGDLYSGRSARRLRSAKLADERPGCRIGLRVQLAFEQRNKVLIVLERFGLASRGGQRLYDQPMGLVTQRIPG